MKINVIASGSKGNCTIFSTDNTNIMIDCGIAFSLLKPHVENMELNGVFLTHAHADHVSGLPKVMGNINPKLYLTKGTEKALDFRVKDGLTQATIQHLTNEEVIINDLRIKAINVSHDCMEPVGYIIYYKDKKIVFVTDTGVFYHENEELISNADLYLFESNYDPIMLNNSSRPFTLKQRISGLKGHLSNTECGFTLSKVIGPNTKEIVLLHLSRDCNTKEIALNTVREYIKDLKITITDQYQSTSIKI